MIKACTVLALVILSCFGTQSYAQDKSISVKISNGVLVGRQSEVLPYDEFLGIPFAAPPIGNLRWKSPQPAADWSEPRNATKFSAACIQSCMLPPGTCPLTFSEDCLYLNVWSPAAQQGSHKPVMVFFPGGNYRQDGASSDLYWGRYLASKHDVVLVTVNYRLGPLGFLVTNWTDGNLGIQDQRLALQWVQQNIQYFGGDKNQVTIFGQSAGGASVLIHLYSPLSMNKGLFQRVICMSGSIGIQFKTRPEQLQVAKLFAKEINCGVDDHACFLTKTTEEVLRAQLATKQIAWPQTFVKAYEWSPTIGTEEIPVQALDAFTSGKYQRSPLMIGTLAEEGIEFVYLLFPKPLNINEYEAAIVAVFGPEHAAKLLPAYKCPPSMQDDCRPIMAMVATHKVFSCPSRAVARRFVHDQVAAKDVYLYYYDHALSFGGWGANFSFCNNHSCHGSDLPILFNSSDLYKFNAEEEALVNVMESFWTSFAKGATGPIELNSTSISWPVFNSSNSLSMKLDLISQLKVETNRLEQICDMWDEIGYYSK